MKEIASQIGSLTCHLIEAAGDVSHIFVLCHGFGAGGTDLVPVGRELFKVLPSAHYAMPQGPIDLSEMFPLADARTWWQIEVGHVAKAISSGQMTEIQESVPEGLASARRKLLATIDLLSHQYKVPLNNFIIGGFSQGAMLASDVALSMEEAPAALLILSGTLICKNRWERLAQKRQDLKVFQCHGTLDPVLPYSNAVAMREFLEEQGLKPDFFAFEDQHTIPMSALDKLTIFLKTLSEPT